MINIAIMGFGVVGSGVAETILTNSTKITSHLDGNQVNIKYILDLREFPEHVLADRVVHDVNTILEDDEVSIVVETMGGENPAFKFSEAAILKGKSVVTSNKEVVSTFGVELCQIAKEHNVRYLFEASVGGGIPVIRPMINDLSSNRINKISGILNGTTNYILTSMRDNGATFEDALSCAQKLGYAEANPSADVDGIDAARKIVILAALASGKLADPKKIPTIGITKITLEDTKIAELFGCTIKLIGHATIDGDKLCAFVSPRFVPAANPLSRIDGVFNGILVNANMVGEVMFYGPGAGKLPTASAVVADIIDIIANRDKAVKPISWESASENDISDFEAYSCRRVFIISGNKESVPAILAKYDAKEANGLCGILTDEMTEAEANKISTELGALLVSAYRVL